MQVDAVVSKLGSKPETSQEIITTCIRGLTARGVSSFYCCISAIGDTFLNPLPSVLNLAAALEGYKSSLLRHTSDFFVDEGRFR